MNRAVMSTINIIILIAFLAATAGHAQVTIDVSKITCDQFLSFKVADPRDIGIWLSGYYHGKQGNTVLEPERLKEIAEKVQSQCFVRQNSTLPVMQIVEKVVGTSKK
jgi:acid stress chaperone HdeB